MLALEFYKSWNTFVISEMVILAAPWMLHKIKKGICRTVCPSLAASLEPLTHTLNTACLGLLYRYYFGRCSSGLAKLSPLPHSHGRSNRYSDKLHGFSVTISRCYKDAYVNSFFFCLARLWNHCMQNALLLHMI